MANIHTPPLFSPVNPKELKLAKPLYGGLRSQKDTVTNNFMAKQAKEDESSGLDLLGKLRGIGRLLHGN